MAQTTKEKVPVEGPPIVEKEPAKEEIERKVAQPWRPFSLMRRLLHWDPFAAMEPLRAWRDELYAPDFTVKETKDSFIFKADIPGIDLKNVDVKLAQNRLTVSGHREEEKSEEGETFYTYERSFGSFSRSFALPPGADLDRVSADLKDGVLTVLVPKLMGPQPKQVEVKSS